MELLQLGIATVCTPLNLALIFVGTVFGVIFGALPGVSATMAIVLCTSFTYAMSPVMAIAFLAAAYCASITGGGITAILFKIPGTPASAATTLDGYPMVQRGEAGKALSISLVCSGIGGVVSCIIMYLMTQPLMKAAMKFSAPEQFAVCFLGLSILVFLDQKNMLNTFTSAIIGLWMGTIGLDPFSVVPRFTFGSPVLINGIEQLPFMMGLFAAVEVFKEIKKPSDRTAYSKENSAEITKLASLKDYLEMKWTIIRSGIIGTIVGIMPGAGASISSWLAYSVENKFSKHPEMLGKGDPHGVAASETANNAATGGAMVPLLAMGIPGSNAAAMMMAALAIHGVQMGPLLLKAQPEYLTATFMSMILANVMMVIIALVVAKLFANIMKMPYWILGPMILVLALTGSYARANTVNDIWLMVLGGIGGYFLSKFKFNNAALILGLVLGPILERQLRRGLQLTDNNLAAFFGRPIVVAIMAIFVIMYLVGFYKMFKDAKKEKAAK